VDAVKRGELAEPAVDACVRRVLALLDRAGALGGAGTPIGAPEAAVDRPEHRALAREAAAEAIVLLRNERDALPLAGIRTLAVVGPNADRAVIQGGGSARVAEHYAVSPLAGLRERAARAGVEIVFERGPSAFRGVPPLDAAQLRARTAGALPIEIEFFAVPEPGGAALRVERVREAEAFWLQTPPGLPAGQPWSAQLRATLVPRESGAHRFSLTSAGATRLRVDGRPVLDNWSDRKAGTSFFGLGSAEVRGEVALQAGVAVEIEVDFGQDRPKPARRPASRLRAARARRRDGARRRGGARRGCGGRRRRSRSRLGDGRPRPRRLPSAEAAGRARREGRRRERAHDRRGECGLAGRDGLGRRDGRDRAALVSRPGERQRARRRPLRRHRSRWAAPAHDAGAHGGHARVPRRARRCGPAARLRRERLRRPPLVRRARDRAALRVRHGLSYARFAWGTLRATIEGDAIACEIEIANESARAGKEVVQLYASDVESSVRRPLRWLVAFEKVALGPGERRTLRFAIPERALAFWDVAAKGWKVEPGRFELSAGRSSRELRTSASVEILNPG
jgi:beta-glucosidase